MKKNDIAIIVLAAGGSKRLGQPKQLLSWKNASLLRYAVSCAAGINDVTPFVVTGAQKDLMIAELSGSGVTIIENDLWEAGIATSIAAGLSAALRENKALSGCIFVVCDQPYLSAALLEKIRLLARESGKGMVAAIYDDMPGTPAFFHRRYFPQLLSLQGDEGARKLLKKYPDDLATVPFAEGAIDIDTLDDYQKLTHAY